MTVAEAADELGVDPKTIRNWIHAGKLHAVRQGPMPRSALLVNATDVAKIKRGFKVEAPAA